MVGIEKLDWAAASDKSANTLDYPIDGLTVKFLRVKVQNSGRCGNGRQMVDLVTSSWNLGSGDFNGTATANGIYDYYVRLLTTYSPLP